MDSIFQKPQLKKQTSRNAFDVSQHRVSHAAFGMIIPCYARLLCPDDYIEIAPESQFICDDLARPAFMRLKEHFDFYCVPLSQIWHPFDNFITGMDNYNSTAIEAIQSSRKVPLNVPSFDDSSLAPALQNLSRQSDLYSFNKCANALRLLDLLEYGNLYGWYLANSTDGTLNNQFPSPSLGACNPFFLAAYQKVYFDYFRNPKYEACNTAAYNLDDVDVTGPMSPTRLQDLLQLRYAWAKKDYFTSVAPSILPNSIDIGYSGLNSPAPDTNVFSIPGAAQAPRSATVGSYIQSGNEGFNGEFVYTANAGGSLSNVTALRFAFAYDKLLRRMREAGGTFDAQMLAQYGITPQDTRDGKCYYIGGQTNRLNASDVINTGEQNDLGFIGGNINQYSSPRGHSSFKCHAKEWCIVIGVYHTSLDYDYPSYNTNRFNKFGTRFDFFNPAFENLGLQALYRYELLNLDYDSGETDYDVTQINSDKRLLGYQRRYSEYKTAIDKVFGLFAFNLNVDFEKWVSQFHPVRLGPHDIGPGPSSPIDVAPFNQVLMQYNPQMFSQIVNVPYNGFWNTDPFKLHQYIHAKVISNMSAYSENW